MTLLAAGSPDFPDEITTLDSLIQPIVLARLDMLWRAGLCDGSVHHPLYALASASFGVLRSLIRH